VSEIQLEANSSGTAVFTIAAPASDAAPVITLPDETTTIAGTDLPQTMLNQTLGAGLVMGFSPLTYIPEVATTSGTSVVLATDIPSWVKSVFVIFNGLSTSGTAAIVIQFGTGSPATYVTTGYASSSDNYSITAGPVGSSTAGFRVGSDLSAGSAINSIYSFATQGDNKWVGQLNGALTGSVIFGGGFVLLAAPLTAVRVIANGIDTFDAGAASVIYG
jgi:hypothetical protein